MSLTQTQKIKIVLVGDSGVGKTALIKQLNFKKFSEKYAPTPGVETTRIEESGGETNYQYLIWEIPASSCNSKAEDVNVSYCRGADAVFLCVNLNEDERSVEENAKKQFWRVQSFVKPEAKMYFVGTRADKDIDLTQLRTNLNVLRNLRENLSKEESTAKISPCIFRTSAKDGIYEEYKKEIHIRFEKDYNSREETTSIGTSPSSSGEGTLLGRVKEDYKSVHPEAFNTKGLDDQIKQVIKKLRNKQKQENESCCFFRGLKCFLQRMTIEDKIAKINTANLSRNPEQIKQALAEHRYWLFWPWKRAESYGDVVKANPKAFSPR